MKRHGGGQNIFAVLEIEIAAGPMDSHLLALGMKTDEKYSAAEILKAYRSAELGTESPADNDNNGQLFL